MGRWMSFRRTPRLLRRLSSDETRTCTRAVPKKVPAARLLRAQDGEIVTVAKPAEPTVVEKREQQITLATRDLKFPLNLACEPSIRTIEKYGQTALVRTVHKRPFPRRCRIEKGLAAGAPKLCTQAAGKHARKHPPARKTNSEQETIPFRSRQ